MNLQSLARSFGRNTKEHSPIILSVAAGIGTLATAYLASKATLEAAEIVREHEKHVPRSRDPKQFILERTKLVWKLYIPTGVCAVSTITCIVGANRVQSKKTLAAQAAFAVSERVYSEYRDKVIEEYGERKDQSIRDKIAEEHVLKNPPGKNVIITGSGNVLCNELYTGRYFESEMSTLKKAQNDLNAKLLAHDYATLDDFYEFIGLPGTTVSSRTGWRSTKLMDLRFTTILAEDDRPCLAFEYNYVEPL